MILVWIFALLCWLSMAFVAVAAAAAAILAILPFVFCPLNNLHRRGQRYDAIIVLGNKVMSDGTAGPTMRSRVGRGVELLREGAAPRIVMTGAAVHNQYVEAETMAAHAVSIGAEPGSLVLETEACNTYDNARLTAELMRRHGWATAVVVTSDYHARRAQWVFREHGVEHRVAPAPAPKELGWRKRLRLIMAEHFGVTKMVAKRVFRIG